MTAFKNLITFCFVLIVGTLTNAQEGKVINYPTLQGEVQSHSHFGKIIRDDFSNLNHLKEPSIQEWFKLQDSIAELYFLNNPLMEEHLIRFSKLQSLGDGTISMIRISEAGNYFYLKFDQAAGVDKLFYRENLNSKEKEIFNPQDYKEELVDISYLSPSFDGSKVAIGFKQGEDFSSKLIFYDLKKGSLLSDKITNINPDFGGVEWLPDSSGFIYLYFPIVDQGVEGFKESSFSVIHEFGDDPEKRTQVFGKGEGIFIPENFYPKVKIGSSIDKYVVGYSASSSDYYDGFITTMDDLLKGDPKWIPFFTQEQKIFYDQGEIREGNFIFRQGGENGNRIGQIEISNPNFENFEILAEGTKEDPITQFAVTKDKIYFARSRFGVQVSLWEITSGQVKELHTPLPAGYVSFFGNSVTHNKVVVELDGWISDYTRYTIRPDGFFQKENLKKENKYPGFENLVSEQIMVESHDGVEVPLSLVYRKDLKRNSENEVFVYVYGAYGESLSPFFFPIFLDWAMQGGILAFPHVRGGGEKGKEWHFHGMKELKYNSWKDLIACSEALIKNKMTRKGLISVFTASAGGITAGMAVNEKPDLFSSFIADVPRLHPWGLESSATAASTSYLEYGTVKDSLEYLGLLKMDPYLNIKEGEEYPATLVMPSYQDDRIPLWDSGKYIARLQNTTTGNNPKLLDVDFTSGHQGYTDYDETIRIYSKIFTFARSNMKRKTSKLSP